MKLLVGKTAYSPTIFLIQNLELSNNINDMYLKNLFNDFDEGFLMSALIEDDRSENENNNFSDFSLVTTLQKQQHEQKRSSSIGE